MSKTVISWIDDDSYEIFTFVVPLTRLGFEIEQYDTFYEAYYSIDDILASDLILLDIILPIGRMSANPVPVEYQDKYWGASLLKLLLDKYKYENPILLFSVVGNAKDIIPEHFLKAKNVEVLPKFHSAKELKELVLSKLSNSKNIKTGKPKS
jgi:hypothetical protein